MEKEEELQKASNSSSRDADAASNQQNLICRNDEELACSLYISRASNSSNVQAQGGENCGNELSVTSLEDAIRAADPLAEWHVSETSCGLIAAFAREADAEKLLQRGDLARVFEAPVQVRILSFGLLNIFYTLYYCLYLNSL